MSLSHSSHTALLVGALFSLPAVPAAGQDEGLPQALDQILRQESSWAAAAPSSPSKTSATPVKVIRHRMGALPKAGCDVDPADFFCLPTCEAQDYPEIYPPATFGAIHADYCARNFAYAEDVD